jgi:hypothetical protein
MNNQVSTGISGLDQVIDFLRLGDNVVWQVDALDDYRMVVAKYIEQAKKDQRNCHYIRFGDHEPLVVAEDRWPGMTIHTVTTDNGFEAFTSEIYDVITKAGIGAFYIFDHLSDLLNQWGSDLMIGNFFRIICPYLYILDTVAYFAVTRGAHSFETIAGIRETTQLLLDLYHHEDAIYVHPLKVYQRYGSTMYLPHKMTGDQCIPLTNSAEAARFFSFIVPSFSQANRHVDYWDRLFEDAARIRQSGNPQENDEMLAKLRRLLLTDDGRIARLAHEYFDLSDLIQIKKREIGTGKIGGKAIGMLLSRKIIALKGAGEGVNPDLLEPHDSYYLGADLFYTYIVQNGWWTLRTEQKKDDGYFSKADELRKHLLEGKFPASVREQFQQMLESFGQSPIIVRSSSLLEDDFGNAFAGKYESIFCANQGDPSARLAAFEQAVRRVYASTMDPDALTYRMKRGLHRKDEQMALLVQRVSGDHHGRFFYPLMAGVGHSKNLYVWNDRLDAQAGMLRLVFGLGTRAVDRVEGDYPRIVALDQPLLSSHDSKTAENTYSQHYVDLIDLEENSLITIPLEELIREDKSIDLSEVGEIDWEETRHLAELGYHNQQKWVLNFNKTLSDAQFIRQIHNMIKILENVYQYPIDIEFTINKHQDQKRVVNLLQCRPLQTKSIGASVPFPENIDRNNVFIEAKGHFMGGNVCMNINYVVYVKPEKYALLNDQERYQVARLIGQLNQTLFDPENAPTLLLGPGRWGTSTPSLGVPVNFSEIDNIAALAEVSFETAGMMPELSFGSHFFQDLVEANVFYLAVLPQITTNYFSLELIERKRNIFIKLLPQHYRWADVIQVYDFSQERMTLFSDITSQKILCICLACRP